MGYRTNYSMNWEKQKAYKPLPNCEHAPTTGRFCQECGATVGFKDLNESVGIYIKTHDDINYAVDESGGQSESCKWYDHDKDMIAMSLSFPDVLFKLHGEGEESGDIWDAYYLNGKMQTHKAKVMIDDVDPKAWK